MIFLMATAAACGTHVQPSDKIQTPIPPRTAPPVIAPPKTDVADNHVDIDAQMEADNDRGTQSKPWDAIMDLSAMTITGTATEAYREACTRACRERDACATEYGLYSHVELCVASCDPYTDEYWRRSRESHGYDWWVSSVLIGQACDAYVGCDYADCLLRIATRISAPYWAEDYQ